MLTLAIVITLSCSEQQNRAATNSRNAPAIDWDTTANGLIYSVVRKGTGPIAKSGDQALIHETTKLKDGTVITDTWEMNFPIPFLVDGNQVIDGLNQAVKGMKVGEQKRLIVPPSLSKRSTYPENGKYKPEDTLYYDVILLKVDPASPE